MHALAVSMRQGQASAYPEVRVVLVSMSSPDMHQAVPVVVLLSCCCTFAFATAQADLGALTVGLPRVGAVPRDVPPLLALVAQHCSTISMTCGD